MGNLITKGEGILGKLTVGSTATIAAANITTLNVTTPSIGGTAITATSTEINNVADLSAIGAIQKLKSISLTGTGIGSSAIDTGWALPTRCIVHDVVLNVTTPTTVSSKTMNVGLLATTSGDADGFLVGVSTTGAGLQYGSISATSSGSVLAYWGVYFATTPVANTTANFAYTAKKDLYLDANTSSKNFCYTHSSTANDAFVANILVRYTEIA